MTELRTSKGPNQVEPGQSIPGLVCHNCQSGIALAGDIRTLPVSFDATSPVCQQKGTYRSDEIQTLVAVRRQ
jgi:hypothetical protein